MIGHGMGEYCVDIVMCIDATGSMAPIIDEVKNNAMSFHQKFLDAMEESGRSVGTLRVKVIVFRDYICDTEPMVESKFFTLPADAVEFKSFVSNIEALGGGDTAENALEAFAYALKSDWTLEGSKRRHVILMLTDAPALPLGERGGCERYPSNLPKSFDELSEMWEEGNQVFDGNYQISAGRFIAFVPNTEPWDNILTWSRCWPMYSKAGEGLKEIDLETVFNVLVKSFSKV